MLATATVAALYFAFFGLLVGEANACLAKCQRFVSSYYFQCALTNATMNNVRCFGWNNHNQLGVSFAYGSRTSNFASPMPPQDVDLNGARAVQISSGYFRSCALLATGGVRCWGLNDYKQLGYGSSPPSSPPHATDIQFDSPNIEAIQVAGGWRHSCVLLMNGRVSCFGLNDYYQIGSSNSAEKNSPPHVKKIYIQMPNNDRVKQICAGRFHSCALSLDGNVACWGNNVAGQLGYANGGADVWNPSSLGYVSLTTNSSLKAVKIDCDEFHTAVLLDNGKVKTFGNNNFGKLGYSHSVNVGRDQVPSYYRPENGYEDEFVRLYPNNDSIVRDIACGDSHTCVIDSQDQLFCFGYGAVGQLGYGNTNNVGGAGRIQPYQVGAVEVSVDSVDLGHRHTCIQYKNSLDMKCFGRGEYGALGSNNTDYLGDNSTETPNQLAAIALGATPMSPSSCSICNWTEIFPPTLSPTPSPTPAPSTSPSVSPTRTPTFAPTRAPSEAPTPAPTAPTSSPTLAPSESPSTSPTRAPSMTPTMSPTTAPIKSVVVDDNDDSADRNPRNTTLDAGDSGDDGRSGDDSLMPLVALIVAVTLFICLLAVFCAIRLRKKKRTRSRVFVATSHSGGGSDRGSAKSLRASGGGARRSRATSAMLRVDGIGSTASMRRSRNTTALSGRVACGGGFDGNSAALRHSGDAPNAALCTSNAVTPAAARRFKSGTQHRGSARLVQMDAQYQSPQQAYGQLRLNPLQDAAGGGYARLQATRGLSAHDISGRLADTADESAYDDLQVSDYGGGGNGGEQYINGRHLFDSDATVAAATSTSSEYIGLRRAQPRGSVFAENTSPESPTASKYAAFPARSAADSYGSLGTMSSGINDAYGKASEPAYAALSVAPPASTAAMEANGAASGFPGNSGAYSKFVQRTATAQTDASSASIYAPGPSLDSSLAAGDAYSPLSVVPRGDET